MKGPAILADVLVLDLTISVAGPLAAAMLGDAGARVIKIERVTGEVSSEWDSVVHGMSSVYAWNARNKESVALDLRDPRALEAVRSIARKADVVIENFAPGTVSRLGLAYADVARDNPGVVYAHISGYGQSGPHRDEKAYDLLVQGESGILASNGTPEEMCKVSLSIADIASATYANQAILLALYGRKASGVGQEIDIAMLHSAVSWLGYFPYFYWFRKELPVRTGAKHFLLTPYGPYRCSDDKWINIAVLSKAAWETFCVLGLERPELLTDERYTTNEARVAHRRELEELVAQIMLGQSQQFWWDRLHAIDIPCGKVRDLAEVLSHPQLVHDGAFIEANSLRGPIPAIRSPINFSNAAMRHDSVPVPAQHTRAILGEFGCEAALIDAMLADGAAREAPEMRASRSESQTSKSHRAETAGGSVS